MEGGTGRRTLKNKGFGPVFSMSNRYTKNHLSVTIELFRHY